MFSETQQHPSTPPPLRGIITQRYQYKYKCMDKAYLPQVYHPDSTKPNIIIIDTELSHYYIKVLAGYVKYVP